MLTGSLLSDAATRAPERPAVICNGGIIRYGELDAAANRFANTLIDAGYAKGDRIAILARNLPDYAVVHFGSARAGTVLVNLLAAYAPAEIEAILAKTGATLLVAEGELLSRVASALANLPALKTVVVLGDDVAPNTVTLDDFTAGAPATHPNMALDPSDPFAMTFTGGTTGLPKGALVSHRARLTSARLSISAHGVCEDDVFAVVSPLSHAIALLVWYQSAVMLGATAVFQAAWDAGEFIEIAERERITAVLMVPAQIRAVLDHPTFDTARLAGLKRVVSGGASLPADLVTVFRARLPGAALIDDYGQSETGPLTVLADADLPVRAGTIGRVVPGVEVALLDPKGRPVPTGEVGEIASRGDHLMSGYFGDPTETAAYFRHNDGWGWTGDLGRMDADGFITLVGRSKDMIVSGGENIYPREVELALEAHPLIAECAVIGIADDRWGETLAAFIVPQERAELSGDDIGNWCIDRLARFKRPRIVEFVEALPKTAAGKVRKDDLRTRLEISE